MKSTQSFAAALVLAALSITAHADTSNSSTVIRGRSVVYYGDLDVDTEAGAKLAIQRIERAARKACGGHATFSSYTGSLDRTFEECRTEAVRQTVKQLVASTVARRSP